MGVKTKFDIAVIDRVKQVRLAKNFTQDDIAMFINVSRGFIGQVESPNSVSKYNLNHLNKLALEMQCSPRDFLPRKPVAETEKGKGKINHRGF